MMGCLPGTQSKGLSHTCLGFRIITISQMSATQQMKAMYRIDCVVLQYVDIQGFTDVWNSL